MASRNYGQAWHEALDLEPTRRHISVAREHVEIVNDNIARLCAPDEFDLEGREQDLAASVARLREAWAEIHSSFDAAGHRDHHVSEMPGFTSATTLTLPSLMSASNATRAHELVGPCLPHQIAGPAEGLTAQGLRAQGLGADTAESTTPRPHSKRSRAERQYASADEMIRLQRRVEVDVKAAMDPIHENLELPGFKDQIQAALRHGHFAVEPRVHCVPEIAYDSPLHLSLDIILHGKRYARRTIRDPASGHSTSRHKAMALDLSTPDVDTSLEANHRCGHYQCIHAAHIFASTHADNQGRNPCHKKARDMRASGGDIPALCTVHGEYPCLIASAAISLPEHSLACQLYCNSYASLEDVEKDVLHGLLRDHAIIDLHLARVVHKFYDQVALELSDLVSMLY